MNMKHLGLAVLAIATSGSMAAPAFAVDPCRQAVQQEQQAEQDYNNWVAAHCPGWKYCTGNSQKLLALANRVEAARAEVRANCP